MFLWLFHRRIFTWSHQRDVIFTVFLFFFSLLILQITDILQEILTVYIQMQYQTKNKVYILLVFILKSDFESSLIQIILLLCYAVNFQHFICRHHWLKFPKPWDRDFLFANCSRKNSASWLNESELQRPVFGQSFNVLQKCGGTYHRGEQQFSLLSCAYVFVCVYVCVQVYCGSLRCQECLRDMTIFGRKANDGIFYIV